VTPFLTFESWKARSRLGPEKCNDLYARAPVQVDTCLSDVSYWINARLRKRYDELQYPQDPTVLGWTRDIVDFDMFILQGGDPSSEQDATFKERAETARAEVKEAADAKDGLFDLPLRKDITATGVTKGYPRACSDASPYTWTDRQVGR